MVDVQRGGHHGGGGAFSHWLGSVSTFSFVVVTTIVVVAGVVPAWPRTGVNAQEGDADFSVRPQRRFATAESRRRLFDDCVDPNSWQPPHHPMHEGMKGSQKSSHHHRHHDDVDDDLDPSSSSSVSSPTTATREAHPPHSVVFHDELMQLGSSPSTTGDITLQLLPRHDDPSPSPSPTRSAEWSSERSSDRYDFAAVTLRWRPRGPRGAASTDPIVLRQCWARSLTDLPAAASTTLSTAAADPTTTTTVGKVLVLICRGHERTFDENDPAASRIAKHGDCRLAVWTAGEALTLPEVLNMACLDVLSAALPIQRRALAAARRAGGEGGPPSLQLLVQRAGAPRPNSKLSPLQHSGDGGGLYDSDVAGGSIAEEGDADGHDDDGGASVDPPWPEAVGRKSVTIPRSVWSGGDGSMGVDVLPRATVRMVCQRRSSPRSHHLAGRLGQRASSLLVAVIATIRVVNLTTDHPVASTKASFADNLADLILPAVGAEKKKPSSPPRRWQRVMSFGDLRDVQHDDHEALTRSAEGTLRGDIGGGLFASLWKRAPVWLLVWALYSSLKWFNQFYCVPRLVQKQQQPGGSQPPHSPSDKKSN